MKHLTKNKSSTHSYLAVVKKDTFYSVPQLLYTVYVSHRSSSKCIIPCISSSFSSSRTLSPQLASPSPLSSLCFLLRANSPGCLCVRCVVSARLKSHMNRKPSSAVQKPHTEATRIRYAPSAKLLAFHKPGRASRIRAVS